ncbi:hypothetical protein L1887_28643 [Cichorium endivia]|nr:hypothetical protein L1887_28643 [Cichorium endivia]
MANLLHIVFLLPFIIIIFPTTTAAAAATGYSFLAPSMPDEQQQLPPYNLSTLLYNLGFRDLSVAATYPANLTTIFAPTDESLRSCRYCSTSLILFEHSVDGLYPYHLLRALAFGTKIETLASTAATPLCLTITISKPPNPSTEPTLFVGGVEITRPDLFNDGNVIIHGIQGYLAHLSPFSCQIERMTSLTFPTHRNSAAASTISVMREFLKDAMVGLRMNDYTVLALLLQENFDQLMQLSSMTIFAVDDAGVFGDGHTYVTNFRFHIVPNQRLTASELLNLPLDSVLSTMEPGERLRVTVGGGGGPLSPMRINNVKITVTNIVFNQGIVVHGIAAPFPRVHLTTIGFMADPTETVHLGPTANWY